VFNRHTAVFPSLSVTAAVAYVILGLWVSPRPPAGIDADAAAWAGHGVPAASFFTSAGLFPVYATLCGLLLVVALARRAWLPPVLTSIAALIVAWRLSDAGKASFGRPRPARWFVHHETSFSYASGHATLALAFFGFWAYVAWTSSRPPRERRLAVGLLAAWIAAIGWSRLALGAHFPSDVAGGYLLGAAVLGLAVSVYERVRSGNAGSARQKSAQFVRGKSL
jgi:membrane-associated phospholipid phosphatase